MKIDPSEQQNAIYCDAQYGPLFGNGDIQINSNSNTTNESYSNLSYTYTHPQYDHGTNQAKSFLAGSQYFHSSEIEVYQKE